MADGFGAVGRRVPAGRDLVGEPRDPIHQRPTTVGCWDSSLGKPGAVDIATSGTWDGKTIGLEGLAAASGNHAKVGVSTGSHAYAIFGDMNQQGSLSGPNCEAARTAGADFSTWSKIPTSSQLCEA